MIGGSWRGGLVVLLAGVLHGQAVPPAISTASPQVSFRFDRPVAGVAVPHYTIELHGDGSGQYKAEIVVANAPENQIVEKPLRFSPETVERAFAEVRVMRASSAPCEAKIKNIADTGAKTLTYSDAQGEGSCSFNYTENKGVAQLVELFQGVELTLEAGRALEFKHRFDRLGLDAEMISLNENVEVGRAAALETIAGTLRSIAGDTELIERVRLRAGKLLERAEGRR